MSTPRNQWRILGIIVLIVVFGQIHIVTDTTVALVLIVQCVWRILQMAGDKELSSVTRHHHTDTTLGRFGEKCQVGIGKDILTMNLRMTAMRHHKHIVEATENRKRPVNRRLREYAEHLFLQRILGYTIIIIEPGLGSPTDI